MSAPALWLTNFATVRLRPDLPQHYRFGKVFAIMLKPRSWEKERSWGRVDLCSPLPKHAQLLERALEERSRGSLFMQNQDSSASILKKELEQRWEGMMSSGILAPGKLTARRWDVEESPRDIVLETGCILCCACAVGAECHRRWLAPYLKRAGWDVRLEGLPLNIEA